MSPHAGEILCTQILPKIRSAVPAAVKPVGAKDVSELIQDTIAHAAALLHRNEVAKNQVTPGAVAYFAVKLTRSGRRSTGSSATDAMAPGNAIGGTGAGRFL